MKRLGWFLTGLVLSPEVLVLALVVGLAWWWPDGFALVGRKIEADSEVWKYLPTLTIGLGIYSFNLSSKIRAPLQDDANKYLYEWPMYHFLVDRVYLAMGYSTCAVFGSLALWIFGKGLPGTVVGIVFISSTAVASVTSLTMLLAKQKLTEILVRYR
jgi:hypothetical protein